MRGRRRQHARAGMTFVEVAAAMALLGIVATSVFALLGYLNASAQRTARRLGAAETASRLILQYLDDKNSMPSKSLPVEYGPDLFRWTLDEGAVVFNERNTTSRRGRTGAQGTLPDPLKRLRQVTVRVWWVDPRAARGPLPPRPPDAALTRLVYPLAFRNPDSFDHLINSEQGMGTIIREIMGLEPAPPGDSGGGRGGGGGGSRGRGGGGGGG